MKVYVYNCYNPEKYANDDLVFTWKWTITAKEASGPSISFKKMTLYTLDDGRVVPRINISCQNIKGQ